MSTQIFPTDNGQAFNLVLAPGWCFAMSIDVAKVILSRVRDGQPAKVPNKGQLSPAKWAIMQSAYEMNRHSTDRRIIEAQGLSVSAAIPATPYPGDAALAATVTGLNGANLFSIMGAGGAHALLWYRSDADRLWLCLDPNLGLYQCTGLADAQALLTGTILSQPGYAGLKGSYDNVTVTLS